MIPVGFDFMMALRFVAVLGALAVGYWIFDAIGDQREAKVWASINAAIDKTNADIDKQLSLDERIAAVAEAARKKALDNALKLPAVAVQCPATPAQASALNAIK